MPLNLAKRWECCGIGGADPLVRARTPRPAFGTTVSVPGGAQEADGGVVPRADLSAIGHSCLPPHNRLQLWDHIVRGESRNFPLFVDELAALHGEMYQVGAEAVLQIPIVAGVEKYQIGGLAGFQRSHLFGTVQRVSAVDGSR